VADRSGRRRANIRNQQIDFAMRVEQPKTGGPGCGPNNKLLAALTAAISNVSKPPNLFAYAVLKNARLEIYNGAPHGLCSTLKDKVNTELLSFIKA
jgi:hypothetical protein